MTSSSDFSEMRSPPKMLSSLRLSAGGGGAGGWLACTGCQRPLDRPVVGGLAVATVATLLVLPPIFALVQAKAQRRSASLDPTDPGSSTAEVA